MKLTRIVHIHRPIRTALAVLAVAAVPAGAVAVPAAAGGDRHPGKVSLVSVAATGGGGNGRSGHGGSSGVSAHGRYVLFSSAATDLVDGDTNGQVDVFVRDTVTSRTTLVSVGANGAQGNGESRPGSISADGRYVVFDSRASNLFPGDTNNYSDVFLRDLRTGRTTLVSVGLNGPADLGGFYPDISADGRHVAFVSHATNLVPGDTNDTQDIFVRNLDTRRTELVSLTSEGLPSDQPSSEPSISGNGRVVAFTVIGGDGVIHVRDRDRSTTRSISDGVPVDPRTVLIEAGSADVSTDGRYVVFSHTGMLGVGVYPISNVWLRDLRTNRLELISADYQGNPSTVFGFASGSVSADGRYVAFATPSRTSRTDRGALGDVYRLDRKTGSLVWITHRQDQTDPWGGRIGSFSPGISADGQHVAFDSDDGRLVGPPGPGTYERYLWSATNPR